MTSKQRKPVRPKKSGLTEGAEAGKQAKPEDDMVDAEIIDDEKPNRRHSSPAASPDSR